jgi:hypothetical protein
MWNEPGPDEQYDPADLSQPTSPKSSSRVRAHPRVFQPRRRCPKSTARQDAIPTAIPVLTHRRYSHCRRTPLKWTASMCLQMPELLPESLPPWAKQRSSNQSVVMSRRLLPRPPSTSAWMGRSGHHLNQPVPPRVAQCRPAPPQTQIGCHSHWATPFTGAPFRPAWTAVENQPQWSTIGEEKTPYRLDHVGGNLVTFGAP